MNTFCGYFNQGICKSCTQIEVSYPDQMREKELRLQNTLASYYKLPLLPSCSSTPTGFRNKAKFSVTGTIDQPVIGLLGEDELDVGREILNCPLHTPKINIIANHLLPLIRESKLAPYHIQSKTGELKGIIIFHSPDTDESYVRLVVRSKESLDRIKKHLPSWLLLNPSVKSFSANIQPIPHAILEGEEEIFFTSQNYSKLKVDTVTMSLSPQGFVQTNQEVAQKLYSEAASWVKDQKSQKFVELFSGQGAFSFYVQKNVTKALGIEINIEAAKRARATAQANGLTHLRFMAKDAKDIASELADFNADILLANPPRRGLGESLALVSHSKIKHVIYSSCSVETLSSDLKKLCENYTVKKVKLFDMFPNSVHFETLVLLELNAF